jgi:hypothetical protein
MADITQQVDEGWAEVTDEIPLTALVKSTISIIFSFLDGTC